MITDWTEFEQMCKDAKSDEEILAVVKYLTDNGYGELHALELVQFQLAQVRGEEAPV